MFLEFINECTDTTNPWQQLITYLHLDTDKDFVKLNIDRFPRFDGCKPFRHIR